MSHQPAMPGKAYTSSSNRNAIDEMDKEYEASMTDSSSTESERNRNLESETYVVLIGKQRWGLTQEPFTENATNDEGRDRSKRIAYLEGLRGILALETLLWIFFRTFAPAIVTDTDQDGTMPAIFVTSSPQWMSTIRKVLSPLLFDGQVIAAMYIILIGRTALLTFVERRQALCLAGACIRRPIRILVPVAMALALTSILVAANGFRFAPAMAEDLHNVAIQPPAIWSNALEYFNSLLSLLYDPYTEKSSRAVSFLPIGRIAWFIDVAFQQIYVLVIFAFTLPFTVIKYKVIGLSAMIVLSAWVARWSWYTVTGLALAEFAVVYRSTLPDRAIKARNQRRLSLTPPKPSQTRDTLLWLVPTAMVVAGLSMRYVWVAAAPQYQNKEIIAHANLNTGKLLTDYNATEQAYPRYDAWLLCTGLLMLIELNDSVQRALSSSLLVYFGRLGFSIALISGTLMTSLGALLHYHLVVNSQMTNVSLILFIEFLAMIPFCLVSADWWSRLVDDAGLRLSHVAFRFLRD